MCYGRGTIPHERKSINSTEHALKVVKCDYEKFNANQLTRKFKGNLIDLNINFSNAHLKSLAPFNFIVVTYAKYRVRFFVCATQQHEVLLFGLSKKKDLYLVKALKLILLEKVDI